MPRAKKSNPSNPPTIEEMLQRPKTFRSDRAERLLSFVLSELAAQTNNTRSRLSLVPFFNRPAETAAFIEELRWLCEMHNLEFDAIACFDKEAHSSWWVATGLLSLFLLCYGGIAQKQPAIALPDSLGTLRSYQLDAILAAHNAPLNRGIIMAPTGAGKTKIALGVAAARGGNWVYVTHSRGIVDQVEEQCRSLRIPMDCMTWESATLIDALWQSDGVIVDEVHGAGTPRRVRILSNAHGARIGLSATPFDRSDIRGNSLILGHVGPVIYSIDPASLQSSGYLASGEVI